jgi:hypothetical protein
MKRYFSKIMLLAALGFLFLASCKKDEAKIYFLGGTAPVLTATAADSIPLPVTDTTALAVTFNWTNPNYQFSNGISSMNVAYYLQFDTVGANFSSPNMQTVSISSDLSATFSVAAFNTIMGNGLLLAYGQPHQIQVRIESLLQPFTSASPVAAPLFSSAIDYTVTPYAPPPAVTPPANDSLYIVGSAVSTDNWANPMPPASLASETFTELSPTEYKITVSLVGGGEYKLINSNGSWSGQWSVATADTEPNGGPFVFNGANCIAPAATGTYIIDVNFQTGKFTVTLQ